MPTLSPGARLGPYGQSRPVRAALHGIAAMLALGSFQMSHAQQAETAPVRGKLCGTVVLVACKETELPTITMVVDRIAVQMLVRSFGEHDARRRASDLLSHKVCASGSLKQKGTPFLIPRFEVTSIDDITVQSEKRRADWVKPGVYRTCEPGVKLPAPKDTPRPNYTAAAMSARVQGAVWVEAVVEVDGRVRQTRVIRSLDDRYGLDNEAEKAAKRWQFTPGTKDGQPAPVAVTIEMTFRLEDKPR